MDTYLKGTVLLDFGHPSLATLIKDRGWGNLEEKQKILEIYNFVRDEIKFGYNWEDAIPASRVLEDRFGQCNTKGILFMALLRGVGIPCRFHGFTIHKKLQKGVIFGLWYKLSPDLILHSWVEVLHRGRWLNLEGFILDQDYLWALQNKFRHCPANFCGYGAAVKDLQNPEVFWMGNDTYIQKEGIAEDFGIFSSPDEFFAHRAQGLSFGKKILYQWVVRHIMNRKVSRIRGGY